MKKIIGNYIVASIIKGVVLFGIILLGDYFEAIPILLRFIFYFIIIGLLDWQMMNRIKDEITTYLFTKSLAFSYLTFVTILWITGPLFQLYNYLTDTIVEGEPQMPTSALVIFLVFGLITSFIVSITWTKKNKKTSPNNQAF
jgi:hypothetical protein